MSEAERLIKYPMYSEAIENRRQDVLDDAEQIGAWGVLACADSYGMTRVQVLAILSANLQRIHNIG